MVSHEHRCIFIHISKCAGTSVERAFGVTTPSDPKMGYGWNSEFKLHLQHATPKQMLETGLVTKQQWDTYYKFVIVRNPFARAYSDYPWVMLNTKVYGRFSQFLNASGPFKDRLNVLNNHYMGDHLLPQSDYLQLNGQPIAFDCVIRMENITMGFEQVIKELSLPADFFSTPSNVNNKKLPHYSYFYTPSRKRLVQQLYKKDLDFLEYSYTEKRPISLPFLTDFSMLLGKNGKLNFRLKYPYFAYKWGALKRKLFT